MTNQPTPLELARQDALAVIRNDKAINDWGCGLLPYWQLSENCWLNAVAIRHDYDYRMAGLYNPKRVADKVFKYEALQKAENIFQRAQVYLFYALIRSPLGKRAWDRNYDRNMENLRKYEEAERRRIAQERVEKIDEAVEKLVNDEELF